MSDSVSTSGGSTGGSPAATSAPASAPANSQSTTPASANTQSAAPASGGNVPESGKTDVTAKRYLEADSDDAFVKLKVDGQDQEFSLKDLKRLSSLEQASQKRMQEASRTQRRAEQILNMLEKDPSGFIQERLGDKFDSLAEERLARKYEIAQMSPEQRRIMDQEQQIAQFKQLDLQSKQSLLAEIKELTNEDVTPEQAATIPKERLIGYIQEQKQKMQQHQNTFETEFLGAWKETSLPPDPMWGQWVAAALLNDQKLINAGKKSGEPLQIKEAAAKVKLKLQSSVRSMFQQMDATAIQEFLGQDLVKKFVAHDVERVNRANDPLFGDSSKSPGLPPASDAPKKTLNEIEWRAHMQR